MYQLEHFSNSGLLTTINNYFIMYRIIEMSEDGISVKLATSYTYCETSDLSLTFTGMVTECSFIPFNLPVNKQFDKNNMLVLMTIVVKLHCEIISFDSTYVCNASAWRENNLFPSPNN